MIREQVAKKICHLFKQKVTNSFRILSIGCGNGLADWSMLQIVTERLPDVEINYIGVDIDEKCCEQAREQLSSLRNVKAETYVLNFERVDCSKAGIPPCDLVLAEHIFYYMRDINKAISNAHNLMKPNGTKCEVIYYYWC
jgi:SAM-dependent methyltransferase